MGTGRRVAPGGPGVGGQVRTGVLGARPPVELGHSELRTGLELPPFGKTEYVVRFHSPPWLVISCHALLCHFTGLFRHSPLREQVEVQVWRREGGRWHAFLVGDRLMRACSPAWAQGAHKTGSGHLCRASLP